MLMLHLLAGHCDATLAGSSNFDGSWTSRCSARATVEAHAIEGSVLDHGGVVRVVDYSDVNVSRVAVVVVIVPAPVAAVKADAWIAEAVVNAAIEADYRSPITRMPDIGVILPSPVAGRPEQAFLRRKRPSAGNPIVSVVGIRPITRDPNESFSGAKRLFIDGQERGPDSNGNANSDLCKRLSRESQCSEY